MQKFISSKSKGIAPGTTGSANRKTANRPIGLVGIIWSYAWNSFSLALHRIGSVFRLQTIKNVKIGKTSITLLYKKMSYPGRSDSN